MRYLNIFTIISLLIFGACSKSDNIKEAELKAELKDELSYVDNYSKGTVSLTLDGVAYEKEFKTEATGLYALSNENHAVFDPNSSKDSFESIKIQIKLDDIYTLIITVSSINEIEKGIFPDLSPFDEIKASSLSLVDESKGIVYDGKNAQDVFVKVTEYDFDKRMIKGEFEGPLSFTKEVDITKIKDGKFSIIFTN